MLSMLGCLFGIWLCFLVLLRNRLLQSCISPQDPKLITSEAERAKNMHSSGVLKPMLQVLQAANWKWAFVITVPSSCEILNPDTQGSLGSAMCLDIGSYWHCTITEGRDDRANPAKPSFSLECTEYIPNTHWIAVGMNMPLLPGKARRLCSTSPESTIFWSALQ